MQHWDDPINFINGLGLKQDEYTLFYFVAFGLLLLEILIIAIAINCVVVHQVSMKAAMGLLLIMSIATQLQLARTVQFNGTLPALSTSTNFVNLPYHPSTAAMHTPSTQWASVSLNRTLLDGPLPSISVKDTPNMIFVISESIRGDCVNNIVWPNLWEQLVDPGEATVLPNHNPAEVNPLSFWNDILVLNDWQL